MAELRTQFTRRNTLRLIVGAAASTVALGKLAPIAIAQTMDNIQTVSTDLLNLRSGAGLSFDIVATLPQGTEVAIDAAQRKAADGVNWIFVTVVETSEQGWVDSSFLSIAGSEATAEAESTPSVGAAATSTKWVSVADANLRDGAGLNFTVVTTLPIGQEVSVTGDGVDGDGYTWYPVVVSAQSGWLADIVLTDEKPPTPGFEQGAAVSVNTDLLNLRDQPGVSTGILGTYAFGAAGKIVSATLIVADEITWHQVELDDDGAIGWLAEQYLSTSPASGGSGSDSASVADGPVNLRSSPALTGEVITTVSTGAKLTVIDSAFTPADGYQWIAVKLNDQSGREGWVASEFLSFI